VSTRPVTIVIPTRNRADTLVRALATCTLQDYEHLEFLVSDNASDDDTQRAVAAVGDSRIRYIRTPHRLAMSQNWEFALAHVERGVVLFLGDDDGLLPNAARDIVRLLDDTGCDAIAWREAKYRWPGWRGDGPGNTLRMPLRTGWRVEKTELALRHVLDGHSYRILPSLYWGAVDRAVLSRSTGPSGRYFNSLNPDLYSALATTMAVDRFVWSERPYRINGQSKHSTGVSFANVETSGQSPRNMFLQENNLAFHRDYVLVPSSTIYVAEAYAQAREHVPGAAVRPQLDVSIVIDRALRVAATDRREAYELVVDGMREIARRAGREKLAEELIARHPHGRSSPSSGVARVFGRGLGRMSLTLDGNDFAVRDVHDAAVLCYSVARLFEAGYLSPKGLARRVIRSVSARFKLA
jgi:glycosyltransferase involved in cell wall biosynthesis